VIYIKKQNKGLNLQHDTELLDPIYFDIMDNLWVLHFVISVYGISRRRHTWSHCFPLRYYHCH